MITNDHTTIVALSTPRGYGGIALIRLSGPRSLSIVKKLFRSKHDLSPRTAVFGNLVDDNGFIDTAVATYFKAPHSYTGEDTVEISLHGNPYLCDLVISACKKHGARDAGPGEFTQRAFLNGKMDLSQAEGVADIIYSSSRAAQEASASLLQGSFGKAITNIKSSLIRILSVLELELDFQDDEIDFTPPEDTIRSISSVISKINGIIKTYELGKIIREGLLCPIIGAPNSGKSSLFNAFLHEERVIVSSRPGTTRDYIEETIRVKNFQIRLVDTAGLRETDDKIESKGMEKTKNLLKQSDVLLYVIDSSNPPDELYILPPAILKKTCFVLNKSDIVHPSSLQKAIKLTGGRPYFICSALKNSGIHEIASALVAEIEQKSAKSNSVILTRMRHRDALMRANRSLKLARYNIRRGADPEIISIDLREALEHLDIIFGKTENEDILNNIFNNFCIGK